MASTGGKDQDTWINWHHDAAVTAANLPALLVEVGKIAHTITAGAHGRRRAGPGESFWQFRRFTQGDAPSRIDWRRSARGEHVFVRELEWEAAHTVWLWADRSPSMVFRSDLSQTSKERRAIVLILALAEILVRGGERVAIPGLTRPSHDLRAPRNLARTMAEPSARQHDDGMPPAERLSAHSDYVMASDFLDPLPDIEQRLTAIANQGVRCHLLQVLDPIEESFPFEGRLEFVDPEGQRRFVAGRAQALREAYQNRLAAQRTGLSVLAARLGGTFSVHHTDRPPHTVLLALQAILAAPRDLYSAVASPPASSMAAAVPTPVEPSA